METRGGESVGGESEQESELQVLGRICLKEHSKI